MNGERLTGLPKFVRPAMASLGLMAILSGCSGISEVDLGKPSKVQAAEFTPEHQENRDGACLVSSQGICMVYDTYTVTVPDTYTLKLEQCESGPIRKGEEDCAQKTITVTEQEYKKVQSGSVITLDENRVITLIPR